MGGIAGAPTGAGRNPGAGTACGVCRTDLHVVDGELPPKMPIIPGHEIVGRIDALGPGRRWAGAGPARRRPWLAHTCGHCFYCAAGQENLCDRPLFTGYTRDGGYATATIADARFAFRSGRGGDVHSRRCSAPGLIGVALAGNRGRGERLGLYGFGAAAHIVAQVAKRQGRRFSPSHARRDGDAGFRPCAWARHGLAGPTRCPRSRSTPPSSTPRRRLVPLALRRCARAAGSSAPAST